ncbi:hypothetical protein JCM10207_007767 [Rhodosporidiobolus poonsookiae]
MNPLSGSNRLPVSPHRHSHALPALAPPPQRLATYTPPFPPPPYLRHASLFFPRFYTTPTDESPYSALSSSPTGLRKKSSLSDALALPTDAVTLALAGDKLGTSSDAPILLPTCFDDADRCALLDLSSDGLGVSFAGSAKYGDRDAAAIRANRPVPTQAGVYYFEITVLDKGLSGYIGIGLSHRSVSLSRLPGWEDNSYGYHADDGRAFCCQGTGEVYGPTFATGDVVGCGIDWTGAGPPRGERERMGGKGRDGGKFDGGKGRVFFTKNGEFLGYAFCNLAGKLYPTVGLRTPNERVRANFGADPFRFDIEGLVLDRKRLLLSSLFSSPPSASALLPAPPSPPIPSLLPPSKQEKIHETLQALVGSYLAHHGYAASAAAFTQQVREEGEERARGLVPGQPPAAGVSTAAPAPAPAEDAAFSSPLRAQIRTALLAGDAARALQLVETHFPAALEPDADASGGAGEGDGDLGFVLRCRVFVEAALEVGKAERDPAATELASSSSSPPSPSSASTPTTTLDDLLSLGRSLHAQYSSDPRPAVREELQAVLGVLAYADPVREATGRTRELLGEAERGRVADRVGRGVLRACNLPPTPALEQLYRHTCASVVLAGDLGSGAAAMVDVRREVAGLP